MTEAEVLLVVSEYVRTRQGAGEARVWNRADVERLTDQRPIYSPYLTYADAARYCGCRVKTLQNAKCSGELRAAPVGPGVKFTAQELDRWMVTRG